MKLFKVDFKNAIGKNVVTVPTDSEFLIGLGNGDSTSTAELYDGTTEITPMDQKIGEYTVFRFATVGTPFRKLYKGVIGGNNFETKSLWGFGFDDVDYEGYESVMLGIPENVDIADLNYADATPELSSFQTYVYGRTFNPTEYHYVKTITWTWNAEVLGYETSEDIGNEVVRYIQFSDTTSEVINYSYGWDDPYDGGDGNYDEKTELPKPIPYTQNINLEIICAKQSVAYRDFEGIAPTEVVNIVSESGKFIQEQTEGTWHYYDVDKDVLITGEKSILFNTSTSQTALTLTTDDTTELVNAEGTINAEALTILEPTFAEGFWDGEEHFYEPYRLTINGTTYRIFAHEVSD